MTGFASKLVAGAALAAALLSSPAGQAQSYRAPYRGYGIPVPGPGAYQYPPRGAFGGNPGAGLVQAVDSCLDAVARQRGGAGSIDSAERVGAGWDVVGIGRNGRPFDCRVDDRGRVIGLFDGAPARYAPDSSADSEWDDDGYTPQRDSNGDGVPDDGPTTRWNAPSADSGGWSPGVARAPSDGQWDDEDYARARQNYDRNAPPPLPRGGSI